MTRMLQSTLRVPEGFEEEFPGCDARAGKTTASAARATRRGFTAQGRVMRPSFAD